MCQAFKIATIASTFLIFSNVLINVNSHRLDCWPGEQNYKKFPYSFYFSSRNHNYQKWKSDAVLGKDIDFDPSRRTAVIIHGSGGSSHEPAVKTLVNQLLLWQDMNVIVLNWQQGAGDSLTYVQGVVNTEYAASRLKRLFLKLSQISGKLPNDWAPIHFIGQSLGAHVAGQAAELLRKTNWTIDRITGLDPAGPCFNNVNSSLRLRSSNARYVDIIHTDGATVPNERFGLLDRIGHADFYVNGGSVQPGCLNNSQGGTGFSILNLIQHAISGGSCHHNRAFTLFIQSVILTRTKTCKFWAHPWSLGTKNSETSRILKESCNENNCVEMGINSELYDQKQGTFYVKTTAKAPYCNIA